MKKLIAIMAIVLFTGALAVNASASVVTLKAQYALTDEDPKKKETPKKSEENKSEANKEKKCESKTAEGSSSCCKSSCGEGK